MKRKKLKGLRHSFIRKAKSILTNPLAYLSLLVPLFICIATYVVYKTETKTDSGITNLFDSIWHTTVAVVAAYYDFYVKSVPGRLASLVLLLFGMAFWAVIIGKITSVIMDIQNKNNKGLKKIRPMKGHFLICGWRPHFEKLLVTVLKSNPDITPDMIVLVNDAPSEQVEQLRQDIRFKEIKYISGDFSDAEILNRAHIKEAGRVLIIADITSKMAATEIDSHTVLTVLTIRRLNSSVYIAAEILDQKFNDHLHLAQCNEIIQTQKYEHGLLATASSGMGYSNVIKSLIGEDADSGILIGTFPKTFTGKSYGELEEYYSKKSDGEVLVGLLLKVGDKPLLTPAENFIIPENAKSVLIAANQ